VRTSIAAHATSHREHPHTGQEDAPARDEVPKPSGEQQQAAEGDQIGIDDPGEARLREAEVALDRRERRADHTVASRTIMSIPAHST
jgi:hypothetical protein